MNKKELSERDICSKFVTPALEKAGWNLLTQVREEFALTDGRIIVRGRVHTRAKNKRADYVLFYKPNIPIAIIEVKDNKYSIGSGMQQALSYAELLQVPFIFSSNGDGFLFRNNINTDGVMEKEIGLNEFPTPQDLWQQWVRYRNISKEQEVIITQDYYSDGSNKTPRYLHTIVRLPKGVFSPYTGINTNILFFDKGEPTKEVWFFEHPYPPGYKSYSRSKPLTIAEFDREKAWWSKREENEHAWKVSVQEIENKNYNLDFKNPHVIEVEHRNPDELMREYQKLSQQLVATRDALKKELMSALGGK